MMLQFFSIDESTLRQLAFHLTQHHKYIPGFQVFLDTRKQPVIFIPEIFISRTAIRYCAAPYETFISSR